MYPPNGWKNISTVRNRARDRSLIADAVREVHPEAVEQSVTDWLVAFWDRCERVSVVPGSDDYHDPHSLVGLAWLDSRSQWSYVVMSDFAHKIGVHCSLYSCGNDHYRVLPMQPEDSHRIQSGLMRVT